MGRVEPPDPRYAPRVRCPEHGLAAGPDGTCVLCRRGQPRPTTAPDPLSAALTDSSWVGPNAVVLGLVGLALAAYVGIRARSGLGPFAPAVTRGPDDGVAQGEPQADLPPEDGRAPGAAAADPALAAAMREVPVTVYFTTWCPHCRRARAWLAQRRIPYEGLDVELDLSAARELRELNPRGSVPTIVIDGRAMVGFDADEAERRLIAAARQRLAAE